MLYVIDIHICYRNSEGRVLSHEIVMELWTTSSSNKSSSNKLLIEFINIKRWHINIHQQPLSQRKAVCPITSKTPLIYHNLSSSQSVIIYFPLNSFSAKLFKKKSIYTWFFKNIPQCNICTNFFLKMSCAVLFSIHDDHWLM